MTYIQTKLYLWGMMIEMSISSEMTDQLLDMNE